LTTRGIAELNSGELWPLNARILLLAPHALTKGCLRMTERTTQLEAALSAQSALIEEAQAEIINYLSGQIGSPEFIDRIIRLLDGPRQRDVQRQAREALGDEEPGNIA
jgi:HEAT repeat protein